MEKALRDSRPHQPPPHMHNTCTHTQNTRVPIAITIHMNGTVFTDRIANRTLNARERINVNVKLMAES